MKIRITGASKKTYWYAENIGELFETDGVVKDGVRYMLVDGTHGVQLTDCEVVSEDAPITVLPDESLGGVLREYGEVKRKAAVGERIKIVNNGAGHGLAIGHITVADSEDGAEDWALYHVEERENPDYVVLEPTEILRIDTSKGDGVASRFRMVERKAAVGERVIVTKTAPNYGSFSVGEHGIVTGERGWVDVDVNVDFGDKTKFIGPSAVNSEYAVLEPLTQEPAPLSALPLVDQYAENITVLTRKIAELEERILALETDSAPAIVKVTEGSVDNAMPTFSKADAYAELSREMFATSARKSPQQIRDEIVERAKADLVNLADGGGHYTVERFLSTNAEYVVDRDKRKVTVILRGINSGKVRAVGRSKCAPGDVFNAALGRAITLRRALGLEVPAEYLTCPQPEEVRVGDVIQYEGGRVATVVSDENSYAPLATHTFLSTARNCAGKIIDDSRTSVAEDGGNSASPSALKGAA